MTPEQVREYAKWLVFEHSNEVEYLSVWEMWKFAQEMGYAPEEELQECDAHEAHNLASKARVIVLLPGDEGF